MYKRQVVNRVGSLLSIFFTSQEVDSFRAAVTSDVEMFKKYFAGMLNKGIYLAPSQFEAVFVNDVLSEEDLQKTEHAVMDVRCV